MAENGWYHGQYDDGTTVIPPFELGHEKPPILLLGAGEAQDRGRGAECAQKDAPPPYATPPLADQPLTFCIGAAYWCECPGKGVQN